MLEHCDQASFKTFDGIVVAHCQVQMLVIGSLFPLVSNPMDEQAHGEDGMGRKKKTKNRVATIAR
jgi:hypothetical protein